MEIKKLDIKYEIKKMPESQIEISGEIGKEILKKEREIVLNKISKNIEIQGFRKGQAPNHIVIQKVGEMAILEEAAELLIGKAYSEIIKEQKIDSIGRPEVVIIKLAPENNLEFKIKTAVMPEIKLASYTDIASKKSKEKTPEPEVSEKEVEEVLDRVKKDTQAGFLQDKNQDKKLESVDLNDKFAQYLGFKNLDDFKERIKEDIKSGKNEKEKTKRRMSIIEDVIKDSVIDLPNIMIESELQSMLFRFKDEVESNGLNFKDYLSKIDSSEEKLMTEWRPQAEKKSKIQLVLNKIAEEKKIKAPEEKIESEVDKVIVQYPDADRQKVRILVETMLLNEAVFEFLEN